MQKIQILFPEPQMKQLRDAARREDRPISEIVRRAVEIWLDRHSTGFAAEKEKHVPVFHGGQIGISSAELRQTAYQDRDEKI